MMRRSRMTKLLAVLLPTLALVVVIGVGGAQQGTQNLFDPVYEIYEYIQSYFYKPELIDNQQALYGAMKGIVKQLDDPYSEFLDPEERKRFDESLEGEFTGVGIEITLVDNILTVITPLVGTPAEAAGVLAGDRILSIDGNSTEGITLSEAAYQIRGEVGTTVTLTVRHEDETDNVDVPIVRDTIIIEAVESELKDEGTIGYVRILRFESDTTVELDQALGSFDLNNLTGLILDLRNNAGGLMSAAVSVSSRFIDQGIVMSTHDRVSGDRNYFSRGNRLPNLPLVILINRGTASSSEIVAGAIRDNNMAILIGQNSFGKGVYQQLIVLRDGSALKLTAGEYFTPSGRVVHEVGLVPDIEVADEEDPIEVAIDWINGHAEIELPIDWDQVASQ